MNSEISEEDMALGRKKKAEETVPETDESIQEEAKTETAADNGGEAPVTEKEKELNEKLKEAQDKAEEYLNMAQRVQADFDNYRRRNKDLRAKSFEDGAREFIKTLLPVMDNLERALGTECADTAFRTGVEMVYRQLSETLTKRGVSEISRAGEKFDPNLENAVLQGTADEGEPGTVCMVLQKGYRMGETVLRHAMVKVVAEA